MPPIAAHAPQYLHTPRLTLEVFNHSDAHYACLVTGATNPTAIRAMGGTIPTAAHFRARGALSQLTSPIPIDGITGYIIHLKPDRKNDNNTSIDSDPKDDVNIAPLGPPIGTLTLAQRHPLIPPDLGYVLHEPHRGHGYATEAGRAFLAWATADFGLKAVTCMPRKGNPASVRVAEKLGFVEGGTVRDLDGEAEGGEERIEVMVLEGRSRMDPGWGISRSGKNREVE